MKELTLEQIARFAGGQLVGDKDCRVTGVSIDTRTLSPGDLYIPFLGERLDGHRFIDQAFVKGARCSFIDRKHPKPQGQNLIVVEDTLLALQRLAKNYRASLPVRTIGITGSNGKTTTKDILHSVLKQHYRTQKTLGNLNNEIGVPLTLLKLNPDTEVGIVEMGMDNFHQIDRLSDMAQPEMAVITNVGDVHLEWLKTRENVAKAKLEITHPMDSSGIFFYNGDDSTLNTVIPRTEMAPKIVSYGCGSQCDHRIKLLSSNAGGNRFLLDGKEWTVNLVGGYQMYNAAVAILMAEKLGVSEQEIQRGLQVNELTAMRTELMHCDGFDILVDCYKSNPQSVLEALHTVELLSGYKKRIAILGDMLELGEQEEELHREIGRALKPEVFSDVLFFGDLSKAMMEGALEHFTPDHVFHFTSKADLIDRAKYLIESSSLVLVKASRALRLEEVVEGIRTITARPYRHCIHES